MALRYFRVFLSNIDKTEDGKVVRTDIIYPAAWDPQKITVLAYKPGANNKGMEWCVCAVEDAGLIGSLLQDNNVHEINENAAGAFVDQVRKKFDVFVKLNPQSVAANPGLKALIEDFLVANNLKYVIR